MKGSKPLSLRQFGRSPRPSPAQPQQYPAVAQGARTVVQAEFVSERVAEGSPPLRTPTAPSPREQRDYARLPPVASAPSLSQNAPSPVQPVPGQRQVRRCRPRQTSTARVAAPVREARRSAHTLAVERPDREL